MEWGPKITTTTYVVVNRIASLSLLNACSHSGDRTHYVFHFLKRLVGHDVDTFRSLKEDRQNAITLLFERAERTLLEIPHSHSDDANFQVQDTLDRLARTLVNDNADMFLDGFNRLHRPAERLLDSFIDGFQNSYQTLAANIKLQPGKTADKITYGEKIRLTREALRIGIEIATTERALVALSHTVPVRNSFVHPKGDRITMEALIAAIEHYGEFYRWRA